MMTERIEQATANPGERRFVAHPVLSERCWTNFKPGCNCVRERGHGGDCWDDLDGFEQATANPGEVRELPQCRQWVGPNGGYTLTEAEQQRHRPWFGPGFRCVRPLGHEGLHDFHG
jgi:hypothetical protein